MARSSIIRDLGLQPHPEGGYFRETYRATGKFGDRAFATTIYFLLETGQFSAFHRIRSDEGWHFYQGDPLHIYVLEPGGALTTLTLGNRPDLNEPFQAVVPAGRWFASRPGVPTHHESLGASRTMLAGYSLVGCTVSPGFDFADFELAEEEELLTGWPAHADLISSLCRHA